jgi:hypothetical protein
MRWLEIKPNLVELRVDTLTAVLMDPHQRQTNRVRRVRRLTARAVAIAQTRSLAEFHVRPFSPLVRRMRTLIVP